tara:strand:- start:46 stop:264 length:219 start_codon:yes stop_codon:yes gene_type:complete
VSSCVSHSTLENGVLEVKNLKLEYQENPQGIDIEEPRFSWILEGEGRNRSQLAYQIVVSSDTQKLNTGDWDI